MECVAFEYDLDFELERPSSAKRLASVIYFDDESKSVCIFLYGNNNKPFMESF